MTQQVPDAFDPLSERETVALTDILRDERTGGLLLLVAAVVALVWANVSPESYLAITKTTIGPASLGLDLTLADWAKDGLLAIFFLVVGLELKREFTTGELANPAEAVVPIMAAVAGMAVPALFYVLVNSASDTGNLDGWAIPAATDIAFALGVLAVVGRSLPTSLRAFLLTLAVVDDLLAILIIAVVFTGSLNLLMLGASIAVVALYSVLQRAGIGGLWLYIPLWVLTWVLMHESGVHATVAGVLVGLATRATPGPDEEESVAERYEHMFRPISAAVAVPLFAFLAAGVTVNGETIAEVFTTPIGLGIIIGLVLGKTLGITSGTWVAVRYTKAQLAAGIRWPDLFGVAAVAGIGFTVSILIATLAFDGDDDLVELGKTAVLTGSVIAAVLGGTILGLRSRTHRRSVDLAEHADG
jgi:NhaA family Na+:H+ antiporter